MTFRPEVSPKRVTLSFFDEDMNCVGERSFANMNLRQVERMVQDCAFDNQVPEGTVRLQVYEHALRRYNWFRLDYFRAMRDAREARSVQRIDVDAALGRKAPEIQAFAGNGPVASLTRLGPLSAFNPF